MRLHYDPLELQQFDNIECHWPLFFCFQLINKIFQQYSGSRYETDFDSIEEIRQLEEQVGRVLIYEGSESKQNQKLVRQVYDSKVFQNLYFIGYFEI